MHGCLPNSGSRRATGLRHQYGADGLATDRVSKTDRQGAGAQQRDRAAGGGARRAEGEGPSHSLAPCQFPSCSSDSRAGDR